MSPTQRAPSSVTPAHQRRPSRTVDEAAALGQIIDLTTPPTSPGSSAAARPLRTYGSGSGRKGSEAAGSLLFDQQPAAFAESSRSAAPATPASDVRVPGTTRCSDGGEGAHTLAAAAGSSAKGKGKEKGVFLTEDLADRTASSPRKRRRSKIMIDAETANGLSAAHTPSATLPAQRKSSNQPEKRVLPNRIRRAAGGGAEGIRDLEEMVLDWLERYGAPSDDPPESLSIYLTSLPLAFVDPAPSYVLPPRATEAVTLTPTRPGGVNPSNLAPSPRGKQARLEQAERIETPSWSMVKPGEDAEWEARGEIEAMAAARLAGLLSPVKRLRKALPDDPSEDMSDAHYIALHKKCEAFERRQRIREKETLQFERYKLKSRIELLRNMSTHAWVSVVRTVLARHPDTADGSAWKKGNERVRREGGIEWLRGVLIKEGLDVLQRYDQLLPNEKRQNIVNGESSRHATPISRASTPPEDTEMSDGAYEPRAVDRRLAALRGHSPRPLKRGRRASSPMATKRKSQSTPSATRKVQSLPRGGGRRESIASPSTGRGVPRRRGRDEEQEEVPRRPPGRPRKNAVPPIQPSFRMSAGSPLVLTPGSAAKSPAPRTSKRSSAKEHVSLPPVTRRPRGSLGKGQHAPKVAEDDVGFWRNGSAGVEISSYSSPGDASGVDPASPKRLQEVTREDVLEMREVEAAVVI